MDEKKVREAIYCMKSFADDTVCEECDCYDRCDHTMVADNAKTAIEALEKQLPKKPVLKRNAYGGISVCPICGASDYGKYCRRCGQQINWEEEENERTREDFGRK